jgi:hypothetical protein
MRGGTEPRHHVSEAMRSIPRIALDTLLGEELPDFERELRVRQVVDLARQTPFHAVGNVGNGMLLAGLFWSRLPHAAILGWLGVFTLVMGFEFLRWRRKRRWPVPTQVSRRAIRSTTIWALFCGLMWAVAMVFAFPIDDMPLQLLILFLAGGLGAGAVATMTSQPIACLAYPLGRGAAGGPDRVGSGPGDGGDGGTLPRRPGGVVAQRILQLRDDRARPHRQPDPGDQAAAGRAGGRVRGQPCQVDVPGQYEP